MCVIHPLTLAVFQKQSFKKETKLKILKPFVSDQLTLVPVNHLIILNQRCLHLQTSNAKMQRSC